MTMGAMIIAQLKRMVQVPAFCTCMCPLFTNPPIDSFMADCCHHAAAIILGAMIEKVATPFLAKNDGPGLIVSSTATMLHSYFCCCQQKMGATNPENEVRCVQTNAAFQSFSACN